MLLRELATGNELRSSCDCPRRHPSCRDVPERFWDLIVGDGGAGVRLGLHAIHNVGLVNSKAVMAVNARQGVDVHSDLEITVRIFHWSQTFSVPTLVGAQSMSRSKNTKTLRLRAHCSIAIP